MRITQRQVTLLMLAVMSGGVALITLSLLFAGQIDAQLFLAAGAFLLLCAMLAAYWRGGFDQVRYAVVAIMVLLVGFGLEGEYLTEVASLAILLPPVLALVLAGPVGVAGSAVAAIALLIARAGFAGVYANPLTLVLYAMLVGGMILARLVTDTAHHQAEEQARRAEAALAGSEAKSAELAQKAEELARRNEEQGRLIDLVATLETPAVALAEGVLLAPVVGHLDSRRAGLLTERLLHEVSDSRARLVILDIAGVPAVDTGVAQSLLRAVQAVRLLGCEVTITGISASIAATLTQLGVSLTGVRISRTPQEALEHAMAAVAQNGARRP